MGNRHGHRTYGVCESGCEKLSVAVLNLPPLTEDADTGPLQAYLGHAFTHGEIHGDVTDPFKGIWR
jgi:hypothetical protein